MEAVAVFVGFAWFVGAVEAEGAVVVVVVVVDVVVCVRAGWVKPAAL